MKKLAIHSVPRSGSTWLGSIFDSHPDTIYKYQPLFSYKFKDYLNENSTRDDIDSFFRDLKISKDDFLDQTEAKKKGIIPSFDKNPNPKVVVYKEVRYHHILKNMMEVSTDLKLIGIVRNPLSTIHSWLNAPKEFRKDKGWKSNNEWLNAPSKNKNQKEEFNGYNKWKETALLFEELKKKYPLRFMLVSYSELIKSTDEMVEQLFSFCELEIGKQTNYFLKDSRDKTIKNAYSVYRNKVSDSNWKGDLNQEIVDFITADLGNSVLEKYLK